MKTKKLKNSTLREWWGEPPEQPLDPPEAPKWVDDYYDALDYAKDHPIKGGDYEFTVADRNVKIICTKKRDGKLKIRVVDDLEDKVYDYDTNACNSIDEDGDARDDDIDYFLDCLDDDSGLDFGVIEKLLVAELTNDNDYNIKEGAYYVDFYTSYDADAEYEADEDYDDWDEDDNNVVYSLTYGSVFNPEIVIEEIRNANNRPVYMSSSTKRDRERKVGYYNRPGEGAKPTVYQRVLAKRNVPIKRKRK